MHVFLEWLNQQSQLVDLMQIFLDLGLIAFLVVLLLRRPKLSASGTEELTQSLTRIIEETQSIASAFDTNLEERRQLIHQLLGRLDQRMAEASQLCKRIEGLQRMPASQSSIRAPLARHSESDEILRLARKGLAADAIAQRLQKPVGEVELVLSLKRMSPEG